MSLPGRGTPEGGRIRVLPDEVASRIAAGEVVERPVSVVRELLDNAIDAGATRITLEIEDGGIGLVRVVDDGRGIRPDEVEVAFERHATSKIARLDDLGHVRTLGFRGEALPSIAAAGDVELVTRARGEPVAVALTIAGGRVVRRQGRPAPEGTSMAVRDLFARVPARRKFLHSNAAESRAITVLATHYALAYPEIAFQVVAGGRRSFVTSGDGDLRHAFAAVYGAAMAEVMLELDYREGNFAVIGLAGPPSTHRGNRSAISIFVNGRWVQSRALSFAVVDAYQSQLPVGRSPVAAVHLALPDDEVDVNVHPAKAEVRFRDERAVARAIRHALLSALAGAPAAGWTIAAPPGEVKQPSGVVTPGAAVLSPLAPLQSSMPLASGPGAPPPGPHFTGSSGPRASQRDLLPLLRVVGQMDATYIVAEGPDGMYLLDQHAAHERVVYDRLLARGAAAPAVSGSQPLLEPVLLEMGPALSAVAEEHREALARLGLELDPFGEGAALVRAIPAGFGAAGIAAAVHRVLEELEGDRNLPPGLGRAVATVACHSSVRAGMALSLDEMRRLVEDLALTASPRTCPHGRPTVVHLGREAIERQFGRS